MIKKLLEFHAKLISQFMSQYFEKLDIRLSNILDKLIVLDKRIKNLEETKINKTSIDEVKHKLWDKLHELQYNDPRRPEYLFYEVCKVAQKSTINYIYSNMKNSICITNYEEFLQYCIANANLYGDIFEFGVYSGYSINKLAEYSKESQVYGFDSFEGLPEDWKGYHKFDFNRNGELPSVHPNVKLIKGWFNESLPSFLRHYDNKTISLLHIDCDLYSSTKDIFINIRPFFKKDLIIIFDEYFNYPNYEEHEFRAFKELVQELQLEYEYLAYCGERVAIKIK